MEDYLIEAIQKIGNHPRSIKVCEPNVAFPMKLQGWMVKRTLYAVGLLQDEWKCTKKKRSGL